VTRSAADQGAGLGRPAKIIPRKSSHPMFAIDPSGRGVAFWNFPGRGSLIRATAFPAP
jgi:hypothetical protein